MKPRPWKARWTGGTVDDCFTEKVTRASSGCWLWTGATSTNGYGRFWIPEQQRAVQAHRYAYEMANGEIPTGLQIDHLCRNKLCVNPDHLEAVTQHENLMRSTGISALNAQKTHCKRGHEFTPENTYIRPAGQRLCRKCRLVRGEIKGLV